MLWAKKQNAKTLSTFVIEKERARPGQNTAGCVPGDRKLYDFISDRSPAFIGPMSERWEKIYVAHARSWRHISHLTASTIC